MSALIGFDGYQPSDLANQHMTQVVKRAMDMDSIAITNPCFAGDTLVHTRFGHYQIKDLVGREVDVWNGADWVTVDNFRVTGENQKVYRLTLHDGSQITATPYHRFLLSSGQTLRMDELRVGDELMPSEAPETHGNVRAAGAYVKGFLLGDGTVREDRTPLLWFYPTKHMCANALVESLDEIRIEDCRSDAILEPGFNKSIDRWKMHGLSARKSLLPWACEYKHGLPAEVFEWDKHSKLELIAGLFDSDGTAMDTKNGFGYQLSSVSRRLLQDVQTILKTVGVQSKIQNKPSRQGGIKDFGDRGGKCRVQPLWRMTISQANSIVLARQCEFSRLASFANKTTAYNVKSKARRIVDIETEMPLEDKVYCCTITQGDDVFSLSSGIRTRQCGEIPLAIWGGFCLLLDLVPYHALVGANGEHNQNWITDLYKAASEGAKFLVRTNLMRSLYKREVDRTNRIGVGLTGIHEFAWKAFGLTFRDLLDERGYQSSKFWNLIAQTARQVVDTGREYSRSLRLNDPDTYLTIKPSGTVSKLWALTEGWHLPAYLWYLRWVQFREDDPLVKTYRDRGYPVRGPLKTYQGTVIVGFPTRTTLAEIMPADKIITAGDATMEEQFEWVRLCEKYWLSAGGEPGYETVGGQVSYTLKYDPDKVSMDEFARIMKENVNTVRAISVMPSEKGGESSYEYLPEEPITAERYDELVAGIDRSDLTEGIDEAHVMCDSGACGTDFK